MMTGMSEMGDQLWNPAVGPADYTEAAVRYQTAVLDQYKLCVEMADRISGRRSVTNTFFLSLNSAVVAVLGATGARLGGGPLLVVLAGLVILLAQCGAWFMIVRSYRQLNGAKFEVIGALEERLPAFAYSHAEWAALGEGRDWRKYLPLTRVEQWVPLIFALSYVVGFFAIAAAHPA
jgi:hypothetical protein